MEDELQAGETRKIPRIWFRESCQEMTQACVPVGGEGREYDQEGLRSKKGAPRNGFDCVSWVSKNV